MNKTNYKYITVSSDERDRIFGGVLSEQDFSTSYPSHNRIEKIAHEIDKYRKYKAKYLNEWGD